MPDTPIQTTRVALDTGLATAGGLNTITDSLKGWAPDQWLGYQVTIMSGVGFGQSRLIASNTATALTTSTNWTTQPTSASSYAINAH